MPDSTFNVQLVHQLNPHLNSNPNLTRVGVLKKYLSAIYCHTVTIITDDCIILAAQIRNNIETRLFESLPTPVQRLRPLPNPPAQLHHQSVLYTVNLDWQQSV